MNPAGLVTKPNRYPVDETQTRLIEAIASHGLTVFAQIDHAAAAAATRLVLWPTMVVIFGNPAAGTLLMQSAQTIGIDLPLKAMIWEDEAGKAWLSHDDLFWLADRHGLTPKADVAIGAMIHGLTTVVDQATGTAEWFPRGNCRSLPGECQATPASARDLDSLAQPVRAHTQASCQCQRAAILEVPLKCALLEETGAVRLRWLDPQSMFAKYRNDGLTELGDELASTCLAIADTAVASIDGLAA